MLTLDAFACIVLP